MTKTGTPPPAGKKQGSPGSTPSNTPKHTPTPTPEPTPPPSPKPSLTAKPKTGKLKMAIPKIPPFARPLVRSLSFDAARTQTGRMTPKQLMQFAQGPPRPLKLPAKKKPTPVLPRPSLRMLVQHRPSLRRPSLSCLRHPSR